MSVEQPTTERPRLDFARIAEQLKLHDGDKDRILTIGVWGWEGSGKTTSLLTFFQLADPLVDGIGLDYVKDMNEFEEVFGHDTNASLLEIARSTPARLKPLAEKFFDEGQWVDGTNRPSQYLFKIRGGKTLGYVYFTDIPGGMYRDEDETATVILKSAHGMVVIVDPGKYHGNKVDDKEYRNEVESRIARCGELKIPTTVMLTKSDSLSPIPEETIDWAAARLETMVSVCENIEIHRTSVFGDVEWSEIDVLPPTEKRDPKNLIFAWSDLLTRALQLDKKTVHAKAPPLQLRSAVALNMALPATQIPEIRMMGSWSGSPGRILCARSDSRRGSFLSLDNDGNVWLVQLRDDLSQEPELREFGRVLEPPAPDLSLQCRIRDGQIFLAAGRNATTVWHGAVGDTLRKFSIHPATSWTVAPGGVFIGASREGAMQIATFGEKVHQRDLRKYLSGSDEAEVCVGWWEAKRCVAMFNGTEQVFVQLEGETFGPQLSIPGFTLAYEPHDLVTFAPSGLAVIESVLNGESDEVDEAERILRLFSGNNSIPDVLNTSPGVPWTTAESVPIVAHVVDDQLHAALIHQTHGFVSSDEGAEIPTTPESMVFSADARTILVTFDDDTYGVFELKGWPHV
jgi:hypothetical protein